jgi:multidrug efflux pump subunit AcrA (membrane-fusion protein)
VVGLVGLIILMAGAVRQKAGRVALDQATATRAAAPSVGVVTLTLEPRTVRDRITLPAEIEAWESLDVKAEVSGTVQEVLAPEGTRVEAGLHQTSPAGRISAEMPASYSYELHTISDMIVL